MTSLMVLARRVLGRRGTFLLRSIASSLSYYTGLYEYADSTKREDGISALMCTYNEEDWVEPAILSIKDLVDEYVIADSSSDRTPIIVEELAKVHDLRIKLVRAPPGDLVSARIIALKNSSYKWLMPFDADVVFYEHAVDVVKNLIEGLNPKRHYLVYWKYLLLCGDVHHLCGSNPYHVEHWLFTYSSGLTYKYLDYGGGAYFDVLIAPLRLYKPVFVDRVLGVHLTGVRSPEKLALKHIRLRHRREVLEYLSKGVSLDEALVKIAKQVYGVDDLRELGEKMLREMLERLPKYDEEKFGPLPKVLIEYLKRRGRELLP